MSLALERTFLGHLRTSLALAMLGVLVAQLLRLQHGQNPDPVIGFFVLGIPLASFCIVSAIVVLLLGAFRFWRQQNAILRGKVQAGGWEILTSALVILIVSSTAFKRRQITDCSRFSAPSSSSLSPSPEHKLREKRANYPVSPLGELPKSNVTFPAMALS